MHLFMHLPPGQELPASACAHLWHDSWHFTWSVGTDYAQRGHIL